MKIYTYYEEINFPQQKEMLDLWHKSWTQMGFEAIVLNQQDAKKSPDYDLFVRKMQYIFKEIANEELSPYGLSCFVRWLAYSTVSNQDEKFLVSDYDVINSGGWKTSDPLIDGIHLFDGACPCMASGTARDFKKLCDLFFEITISRLEEIKRETNHYHDQEFFQYNFVERFNSRSATLQEKHNITLTRERSKDVSPFTLPRAYHVSHHNISQILQQGLNKYSAFSPDDLRVEIIKNITDKPIT